MYSNIEISILD